MAAEYDATEFDRTQRHSDHTDQQIADELEGRLIQWEHYWMMFNNPMSEAESDRLAAKIFAERV